MTEEEALTARAAALDLVIAPEYRATVLDNLALLSRYQQLVLSLDLPERAEPAFEYHP